MVDDMKDFDDYHDRREGDARPGWLLALLLVCGVGFSLWVWAVFLIWLAGLVL